MINGSKHTGTKISGWVDAHVAIFNNKACINYQYIKSKNDKTSKDWGCAFHFKNRILTIHYSYLEKKKDIYSPILSHIVNSISLVK